MMNVNIPAHVPSDRVRDVDLYNLPGASEDVHLAWKRVQANVLLSSSRRAMAATG